MAGAGKCGNEPSGSIKMRSKFLSSCGHANFSRTLAMESVSLTPSEQPTRRFQLCATSDVLLATCFL